MCKENKSMDCFLYDKDLRHERVKVHNKVTNTTSLESN